MNSESNLPKATNFDDLYFLTAEEIDYLIEHGEEPPIGDSAPDTEIGQ